MYRTHCACRQACCGCLGPWNCYGAALFNHLSAKTNMYQTLKNGCKNCARNFRSEFMFLRRITSPLVNVSGVGVVRHNFVGPTTHNNYSINNIFLLSPCQRRQASHVMVTGLCSSEGALHHTSRSMNSCSVWSEHRTAPTSQMEIHHLTEGHSGPVRGAESRANNTPYFNDSFMTIALSSSTGIRLFSRSICRGACATEAGDHHAIQHTLA